ncbi:MAG: hypothetical protein ABSF15_25715 [Candidatus Sulfotelmatobacter sp.]|jgi:hypothetical protein
MRRFNRNLCIPTYDRLNNVESVDEQLSSPVYDAGSGNVFVGEGWSSGNPASLASVKATSGALTVNSSTLGGAPIATPLVDSSAGKVYAFIGNDNSSHCPGSKSCSAVYQFPTSLTSSIEAYVGTGANSGSTAPQLYPGTFDNIYFSSSNNTGGLYVCGNTSAGPILYRISISSNTMASGTITPGPTLASAQTTCSPITEVYNTSSGTDHDWIFLSVQANGNASTSGTVCTGSCVYSYDVNSGTLSTTTKATDGITASGGASAIIIDNVVATTGASQIYTRNYRAQAVVVGPGAAPCRYRRPHFSSSSTNLRASDL